MNGLEKAIKKYRLDELLLLLAEQSRELYLNRTPFQRIEFKQYIGGYMQTAGQYVTAWNLADLSYFAIRHSNDYKSLGPTMDDVYKLNNLLITLGNETSKKKLKSTNEEDKFTRILFGMSQKQFWYQEVIKGTNVYYNFLRYYILLNDIPLLIPKHKLPNEDLIEVTGFNINNFLQLMMVGYAYLRIGSLVKIDISNDLKEKLPVVTEENLAKCLAIFTGDYSFYRNTQFPNNPLYLKPLIKTDRGKLIISNAFIWTRKLYEGAYWLIREKYQEIGSQYFINKFGEYYERYIEEVLKYYLRDQQFKKIHEGTKKKADWIIETKNYLLIVEQKSSLMTIALKEEFPPLELLDEYLQRNFKEAYTQLAETKKEIRHADKRVLKFILHFERFYLGEAIIKERIKHIFKDDFIDMTDYFFVETAEFEKLMQVLSEDEETFNKIIETKLSYQEKAPPISEGIEFNFIITKQARVSEIKFLESRRYHFDNLLNI